MNVPVPGIAFQSSPRSRMIGYARVSTEDQSLALQLDALRRAGCDLLHEDHGCSGIAAVRPGLAAALETVTPGDVLVTWKLDRLGRSLSELIAIIHELEQRGIGFRSLSEQIDTTTAGGRLLFHIMGALAEFERGLISERTRAGMAAARARGSLIGRPPKLSARQTAEAQRWLQLGDWSVEEVARALGVSRSTLVRALARLAAA